MNPLPPLPSLAETRAAWRARFLPCYWHNLWFGLLMLCVGLPLAWFFYGEVVPGESVLVLGVLGLVLVPGLAVPPALAMAGRFPSAAQHAKVAEFREVYEAHRVAQEAQRRRMADD